MLNSQILKINFENSKLYFLNHKIKKIFLILCLCKNVTLAINLAKRVSEAPFSLSFVAALHFGIKDILKNHLSETESSKP